jgi:DNA repair protein RadA/Sms
MKTSTAVIYSCTSCDAQSPKWNGQCFECGAWGTLEASGRAKSEERRAGTTPTKAQPSLAFASLKASSSGRMSTGMAEVDRVFGGGITPGSVTLLGGEPGIGKSTLSLMVCAAAAAAGCRVLYVSGEESAGQVKMRADRLRIPQGGLFFLGETDLEAIIAALGKEAPALAVIDSIQTVFSEQVPSEAGAANQVRYAAARLVQEAKRSGVPIIIVGHVTKDGGVAGPKTLEHLVDAVLTFEGERSHPLRVLRALKNRFGSTDETGMFSMEEEGLKEVRNPSAFLLEDRRKGVPGSAVSCILEGTRPMLIEVQALVQKAGFGTPARRATGIDGARLDMLIAVLSRRGGIDLGSHDVYVNVVGGLKLKEPAGDLAVVAALASAASGKPAGDETAFWGEVGLGGEVRSVAANDRRLMEAAQLGIRKAVAAMPRSGPRKRPEGLAITDVRSVRDAVVAIQCT